MAQNTEQLDTKLFSGREPSASDTPALLKQYELFVGTSESLSSRRQGVNTFFLSVNSIILAAAGILWSNGQSGDLESVALVVLGVDPWGQKRSASVVAQSAKKPVGWNRKSVIGGIWELYYK